jgi:hypothetical protein
MLKEQNKRFLSLESEEEHTHTVLLKLHVKNQLPPPPECPFFLTTTINLYKILSKDCRHKIANPETAEEVGQEVMWFVMGRAMTTVCSSAIPMLKRSAVHPSCLVRFSHKSAAHRPARPLSSSCECVFRFQFSVFFRLLIHNQWLSSSG